MDIKRKTYVKRVSGRSSKTSPGDSGLNPALVKVKTPALITERNIWRNETGDVRFVTCIYMIIKRECIVKIGIRKEDNNAEIPSLSELIIRNLLVLLWPIEALMLIIKGKRLGDTITKTDVYIL